MRFDFKRGDFEVGQFVVYFNGGDYHVGAVEVGVVKRLADDGAFVAYHTGDTTANTPYSVLMPVSNTYAMKALAERSAQLGQELWDLPTDAEDWSE